MNKRHAVVLGLQYGDEGKGRIVDNLCATGDYEAVVRFNGGGNAGHTVVADGKEHKLHLLPVGFLHGMISVIAGSCIFDAVDFLKELNEVSSIIKGGDVYIDKRLHVVFPFYKHIDANMEDNAALTGNHIGTTKRGIGPTHAFKALRLGLRIQDFLNGTAADKFQRLLEFVLYHNFYHDKELLTKEFYNVEEAIKQLNSKIVFSIIDPARFNVTNVKAIFEGAQSYLLDIDNGTYPYVTSGGCGISTIVNMGIDVNPKDDLIIGVMKPYVTRIGTGPFYTELNGVIGNYIREKGKEYGATTGRPRRCGWLDIPMLNYSIANNFVNSLAVTKLDVLEDLETVMAAYRLEYFNKVRYDYSEGAKEDVIAKLEGQYTWSKAKPEDVIYFLRQISSALGREIDMYTYGADRSMLNPFGEV